MVWNNDKGLVFRDNKIRFNFQINHNQSLTLDLHWPENLGSTQICGTRFLDGGSKVCQLLCLQRLQTALKASWMLTIIQPYSAKYFPGWNSFESAILQFSMPHVATLSKKHMCSTLIYTATWSVLHVDAKWSVIIALSISMSWFQNKHCGSRCNHRVDTSGSGLGNLQTGTGTNQSRVKTHWVGMKHPVSALWPQWLLPSSRYCTVGNNHLVVLSRIVDGSCYETSLVKVTKQLDRRGDIGNLR